jgi:organic hydroperoxide reductase OsmC/OhrA
VRETLAHRSLSVNNPMTDYHATIAWHRAGAKFTDNRYRRAHTWTFDEGLEVPASASPHSVPLPLSEARAVDPEEALVAAVSSCHMLWFLSIAAKRGFVVERYVDNPVGTLGTNATGKDAITVITLRPDIAFGGDKRPTPNELAEIHHESHEVCCLANSVTAEVRCEPVRPPTSVP